MNLSQIYNKSPSFISIWKITWPIIIANLTLPIVTATDTAVMGREQSSTFIAAIALGGKIEDEIWSTGMYDKEPYLIDKVLKDMIHNNSSENEISNYVFKDNQSIDQASLDLLINGVTSAEELIRVGNLKEDANL